MLPELMDDRASAFEAALLEDDAAAEEMPVLDEMGIRALLIRIGQDKAELNKLKRLLGATVESYKDRALAIEKRIERARGWLQTYVEQNGAVDFPDAGKAHLTTKNKGGKFRLAGLDPENLPAPLVDQGLVRERTVTEFDMDYLDDWLGKNAKVAEDGVVVRKDTGEVITGVEYLPEGKTIAVSV